MTIKGLFETYGPLIKKAARKHGIPEHIFAGLVYQESRGNPKAVSHCGAYGLTQIMPQTAAFIKQYLKFDRNDPWGQLDAGAWYLAWILKRYAGGVMELALAGYNAGPGALLNNRWKRYRETVAYVRLIPKWAEQYQGFIAEGSSGAAEEPPPAPSLPPRDEKYVRCVDRVKTGNKYVR